MKIGSLLLVCGFSWMRHGKYTVAVSQPPSGPSSTSLTTAHRTPVITNRSLPSCIAACLAAGGGVVRVPDGRFMTGPIDMVDKN